MKDIRRCFFYAEHPMKDMPHENVAEGVTLVSPPYNYQTLEKWLYIGNWHAIYPDNKDYKPFNTFKTKNHEIEQRMKEAGVKLVIDSFHDDIEWNVIEET